MKDKCFCHFNGYEVKDATARKKIELLNNYVTPEMFGALGDGVADDTQAFIDAVSTGKKVVANGNYKISAAIILSNNASVCGNGTVKKVNADADDTTGINAIFIIKGLYVNIDGLKLSGSISNNVVGVAITGNSRFINLDKLCITYCSHAVKSYDTCFMVTLRNIHTHSCTRGIDFSDRTLKTSISLDNCYVANCGTPYFFYGTTYSVLSACGADMCNYKDDENPYNDGGHGDKSSGLGIYNFEVCKGVTIQNCATEKSWGNGAIHLIASNVNIDGFVTAQIKSEFAPNYTDFPSFGVGLITTTGEKSFAEVSNLYTDGFENTYVKNNYPTKKQALIACNYNSSVYGIYKKKMLIVNGYECSNSNLSLFCGMGDINTLCEDTTDNVKMFGYGRKYPTKNISGNGNCLSIPIKSQDTANRPNVVKIIGCTTEFNASQPKAFECLVGYSSLLGIASAEIISKSNETITVGYANLTLFVKLPETYTSLIVAVESYGQYGSLIDWDGIKLVTD